MESDCNAPWNLRTRCRNHGGPCRVPSGYQTPPTGTRARVDLVDSEQGSQSPNIPRKQRKISKKRKKQDHVAGPSSTASEANHGQSSAGIDEVDRAFVTTGNASTVLSESRQVVLDVGKLQEQPGLRDPNFRRHDFIKDVRQKECGPMGAPGEATHGYYESGCRRDNAPSDDSGPGESITVEEPDPGQQISDTESDEHDNSEPVHVPGEETELRERDFSDEDTEASGQSSAQRSPHSESGTVLGLEPRERDYVTENRPVPGPIPSTSSRRYRARRGNGKAIPKLETKITLLKTMVSESVTNFQVTQQTDYSSGIYVTGTVSNKLYVTKRILCGAIKCVRVTSTFRLPFKASTNEENPPAPAAESPLFCFTVLCPSTALVHQIIRVLQRFLLVSDITGITLTPFNTGTPLPLLTLDNTPSSET